MGEETFSLLSVKKKTPTRKKNKQADLAGHKPACCGDAWSWSWRWPQRRDDRRHTTEEEATPTQNTQTMEMRHRTHVSTSRRVAPPVQGATPRLNMAIVQFNTGDENLQGGGGEQWGGGEAEGERAWIIPSHSSSAALAWAACDHHWTRWVACLFDGALFFFLTGLRTWKRTTQWSCWGSQTVLRLDTLKWVFALRGA